MSRSGYSSDDLDHLALGRWRAQVASALRGKRGQKLLSDIIEALDAMPEKVLIAGDLENSEGVCALGAVGRVRGVSLASLDTYDYEELGAAFDIAHQLAQEVMYVNDEWARTPEERWRIVREWAESKLKRKTKPRAKAEGGANG